MARGITRRRLIAGTAAGGGLAVAWGLWPRTWPGNLPVEAGEHAVGGWLKLGEDGRVTLAVPVCEGGQGSWTALAQAAADELGADWRTMGVEAAPVSGRYANRAALDALFEDGWGRVPEPVLRALAERVPAMLTAGSASARAFEEPVRAAAATARAMLVAAAAERWDADPAACDAAEGFVVWGQGHRRLRFGELAADAALRAVPDAAPRRVGGGALAGRTLPRLDAPPKADGSALYAGDVRLPDMLHARAAHGPAGGTNRPMQLDRAAAARVAGVARVEAGADWVAVLGDTGWAAERGLAALAPRFETRGAVADDGATAAALAAALGGEGRALGGEGDAAAALRGPGIVAAEYRAATGLHDAVETAAAAASFRDGRLTVWTATEAPAAARAAAARAAGLAEGDVVLHPTLAGGGFGARLEADAAELAAVLAVRTGRPVGLIRTRGVEVREGAHRPPAAARLRARLDGGGRVLAWEARVASPALGAGLARRLLPGGAGAVLAAAYGPGDPYAGGGLVPPYRFPSWAAHHHAAEVPGRWGHLRGGAHGTNCFFAESFLDELAAAGGQEPVSFRIGMLAGEPRLARCLSAAAALGGWDGGRPGSGQGVACHRFRGSRIAVVAQARTATDGRPVVERLAAAVDCGRLLSPDLVRQQVEGGLVFGLGLALGASTGWTRGLPTGRGLDLPRIADCPEIAVELIAGGGDGDAAPGGASELAVPPVAPAVANALATVTGRRWRTLPLA